MSPAPKRDAPIHRNTLFITHFQPASNLIERAMAAAAHIIPQHSGAVTNTGRIGSDNQGRQGRRAKLHGADYTCGLVADSNRASHSSACSRVSPHISREGCNPAQKEGRSGEPNAMQRNSSSSCTHGTPAGLPCGMPGNGELMEGAMQQAAQWGRQSNFKRTRKKS